MSFVKRTPLRYPGGKSKALGTILPFIQPFTEFREPFIGGGSVLLSLAQSHPAAQFWGNDLNRDVYSFWVALRDRAPELVSGVQEIYDRFPKRRSGASLHSSLVMQTPRTTLQRAIRFFILNRITFSGTIEAGGFSQAAFERRFTQSAIDRLLPLSPVIKKVRFSNKDYEELLHSDGDGVFIFLDPPYLSATKSKLYGRGGRLHTSFDHERFAKLMRLVRHQWLITYDDSPEIRKLFTFANFHEWNLQYGMNNFRQGSAAVGKELIITNFDIPVANACE